MRNGWTLVTLRDVLDMADQTVVVESGVEYPVVGVLNHGRGLLFRDPVTSETTKYPRLNSVRPNQVIYSKLKAFEGSVTVTPPDLGPAFASQEFPVFDCRPNILPGFLRLTTERPELWRDLAGLSTGMGGRRERVKPEDFLTVPVVLPPLDEQQRIVDLIGTLDDTISSADAAVGSAEDLRDRLREVLLAGPEVMTVGDVLDPVSRPVDVEPDSQYQEIGLRAHGRGHFDKDSVSGGQLGAKKVFWMTPGALVFSIVFAWEGAVALLPDSVEGKIASHRFPNYTSEIPDGAAFMAAFFRTSQGARLLLDCSPGGAGRNKTLNRGRLMASEIRVPSVDEWPKRVGQLSSAVDHLAAATANSRNLRALRTNLLTILLSGEHEIPPSYDELVEGAAA